jgi:protease-4
LLDRLGGPVLVFGVIGLIVGAAFVPFVWDTSTQPDGTVAIIEMHGTIDADTATKAIDDLREARQNDSIKAVTIDINSRGGLASVSEQLYLAVHKTSQEMPVTVAVTGSALSGGYYMSAPADAIYVSPASTVGSVGVRATIPTGGTPDNQITTGPDKAMGSTVAETRQRVETLRRAFVNTVIEERGDQLALSASELSYAKIYTGTRGVELGLADEIGGIDAAIGASADQAGLSDYRTVRMESPSQGTLGQLGLNTSGQMANGQISVQTTQYLMVHGKLNAHSTADTIEVKGNGTN